MFQLYKLTVGVCLVSCSYDLIMCNIWAPTWWKAQRGRPFLQSCGMMLLLAVAESILPGNQWGCQHVPLFPFTMFFMFFILTSHRKETNICVGCNPVTTFPQSDRQNKWQNDIVQNYSSRTGCYKFTDIVITDTENRRINFLSKWGVCSAFPGFLKSVVL